MPHIEIELRAVVSLEKLEEVRCFLEGKKTRSRQDNKTSYFFVIPENILKIVNQNNKAFIVFKEWDETKSVLHELNIPIAYEDTEKALHIFHTLWLQSNKVEQIRTNYFYKWAEIALKYTKDRWYHIEVDVSTNDSEKIDFCKNKAREICQELWIQPLNENQIQEKINEINKRHWFYG